MIFAQYINNYYFINLIKKYRKILIYYNNIRTLSGTLPRSKSIATKNTYIFIYLYILLCIIILEDKSVSIILLPFEACVYNVLLYGQISIYINRYLNLHKLIVFYTIVLFNKSIFFKKCVSIIRYLQEL